MFVNVQNVDLHDPVPALLRGAWRRTWIRHDDGALDDSSIVVWLQLDRLMADIRVPADHETLADRGSLAGCDVDDLERLAVGESSTGYTCCSPVVAGDDGVRRATARWSESEGDVAFQPLGAYPEPGMLEWDDDGDVMIERAPSGAYVERWERIAQATSPLDHRRDGDEQLYIAGDVAIRVRDRPSAGHRVARLDELIREAGDDRATIEALVDCEFSLAERSGSGSGDTFVITASTHPWRVGEDIHVAVR